MVDPEMISQVSTRTSWFIFFYKGFGGLRIHVYIMAPDDASNDAKTFVWWRVVVDYLAGWSNLATRTRGCNQVSCLLAIVLLLIKAMITWPR